MSDNFLYRAWLIPTVEGLEVYFQKWPIIKETPCTYLCENPDTFRHTGKGTRVYKNSSRTAFKTKEKALQNLLYRKKAQNQIIKQQLDYNNKLLNRVTQMSDLTTRCFRNGNVYNVPGGYLDDCEMPLEQLKGSEYAIPIAD